MFMTSIEPSLSRKNLLKLRKRLAALTLTGVVVMLSSFFFIQKTLYDSAVDQAKSQLEALSHRLGSTLLQNQAIDLQKIVNINTDISVGVLNGSFEQVSGSVPPLLISGLHDAINDRATNRGALFRVHNKEVLVVAYSKLPQLDRIVVTYTPRAKLIENWREAIILHAILFLMGLAIMAGLAIWLWQRLKHQHLHAADMAEYFTDTENALSECGCALISWPTDGRDGRLTQQLNWPEILGIARESKTSLTAEFLDRLSPESRAKLHGPLVEDIWPDGRIGTMVDMRTEGSSSQRFYLMAYRSVENQQSTITVLLLETAARQELCHPFETYLHYTPEPSIAVDSEGILHGFSPAIEKLVGPKLPNLITQPFFKLFEPEDQQTALAALHSHFSEKSDSDNDDDKEVVLRLRDRDGNLRWLSWHGIGPFEGMVFGSARDVTRFVENANKLRDALDQLKRSNEDLEQFAYVASHDLQQPLRMVASYTQLLKRRYGGKLDQEADEYIDYAVDGAKRMHKLITHLLEYAKTGTNEDFAEIDCNQVLNEAQADLKAIIAQEQTTIAHDDLPVIKGDRIGLSRLFQNLLSNAIKYRRPGVPSHIDITVERDPQNQDFWRFAVRDNGIGIHPDHAERIFRLFQRLHKDEFSGTGLGLSLCRKIVEQHGGRIWLDTTRPISDPGTTIIFTLRAHHPD